MTKLPLSVAKFVVNGVYLHRILSMYQQPQDILSIAYKQPIMQEQMEILLDTDRMVPGSVHYSIKRYKKEPQWNIEDTGMLVYHYEKNDPAEHFLELRFCVTGNVYCRQKQTECDYCKFNSSKSCVEKVESVDVLSFSFKPSYLTQFVKGKKNTNVTDEVLAFTHQTSFSKMLPLCGKTRMAIEALLNHTYTDTLENIFINAQTQILLLYSMDCMLGVEKEEVFTCKFLANEQDREKIIKAREVLLQHIGEPLTIKALSKKVAINECYLKKGFKELFGTTIFDFYQSQRMEHAKYLLYEKGLSVTEVSLMLGYSSISHFSTAFKKHTGIKPCELLLH
ncbi:MAG TPA: AraC family transcriptional regulator [Ferruginibacter sp.]|nr:AraC family transcriptional regulator [Ferruginibacter sp.]